MFFSSQRLLIRKKDFVAFLELPKPEETSNVRFNKHAYLMARLDSAQLQEVLMPQLKHASSILDQDLFLKQRCNLGRRRSIGDPSDNPFNGTKLVAAWSINALQERRPLTANRRAPPTSLRAPARLRDGVRLVFISSGM